ncbi:hypothetical protein D5085_18180 [Ectothiorhodospiraceae bacterium BW-2]|nr:hypothetical protein D5085_18180 [Ectothiorhodospiraceae bacterium BW-2]
MGVSGLSLSPEDNLRLNVLLTQAEAVRIDENAMAVYGLMGEQEMRVDLNPTLRADRYLTAVRELLASVVLDSPGGYPVFLRRWTRMGQIDNDQLDRLLRIGEMEAVMAVVCAPGLTDELARKAWWIAPWSEHARRMLERRAVVEGTMGKVLAEHLVEHLPFETEHRDMLDTVRLVLQPGLINAQQRLALWQRGKSKSTYRVGFLLSEPDNLPEQDPPHPKWAALQQSLAPLIAQQNRYATQLLHLYSAAGQTFCRMVTEAMRRPADQEVVSALFSAIGRYFAPLRYHHEPLRTIEEIEAVVKGVEDSQWRQLQERLDEEERLALEALLFLAHFDETVVLPVFSVNDSIGSVMRQKIAHISGPMLAHLAALRGEGVSE